MDDTRHLLSQEALQGDWDQLSDRISNAILEIQKLSANAKEITFNIKFDGDLTNVIQRQREFEKTIQDSSNALENMTKQFQTLSATSSEYGNITTALIRKQAKYKAEIAENERLVRAYKTGIVSAEESMKLFGTSTSLNKTIIDEFNKTINFNRAEITRLEQSIIKARVELSALTPELNAAAQGFRSQITSINELDARVKILSIDYKQLSESQRESVGGKALLADIQSLNIELVELRANMKGNGTEEKEMSALLQKEAVLTARLTTLKTEQAQAVASLNVQNQQQNRINKLTAQENLALAETTNQWKAQVRLAEIELGNMAVAEEGELKVKRDLKIAEIDLLNSKIKAASSSATQQAMTVGAYKTANTALSNTKQQMVAMRLAGKELTVEYKELEAEALRLASAQGVVNEETKVGKSIMEQFGSMFSRQTMRMIGSLVLWQVGMEAALALIDGLRENSKKLEEETSNYEKMLGELKVTSQQFLETETSKTQYLISVMEDLNKSYKFRVDSMKDLIQLYPDLLSSMTSEELLDGKISEKMEKINDIILLKSRENGINKDIEKTTEELTKATQDQIKAENEYNKERSGDLSPRFPGFTSREDVLKSANSRVDDLKNHIDQLNGVLEDTKISMDEILHPKTDSKNIEDLKAELLSLKTTIDQQKLPKDIVDLIEGKTDDPKATKLRALLKARGNKDDAHIQDLRNQYKTLDTQIKILEGEQDKTKSGGVGKNAGQTPTLTSEYELEKQRVNQTAESNKAIADDEKANLDIRLDANLKYYYALYKLEEIDIDKKREENRVSILNAQNKLDRINKGTDGNYKPGEKKKEIDNLNKIIADGKVKEMALTEEFNAKIESISDKSKKSVTKIYETNEKHWLEGEEIKWSQYKGQVEDAEQSALDILKDKLDKGLITRKQYNKSVEVTQDQFHKKLLKDEIDSIQALLDADRLDSPQWRQHKDKQNSLKNQYNNLYGDPNKKDTPYTGGVFPHLDDAQLQSEVLNNPISTEAEKLKAKQKLFSDYSQQTIEIVQQTEASIKQIKDNQFAHEQQQLQIQMRSVQLQSQQQIEAINASVGYEITKKNQASLLIAQTTSQENNIRQQQNQLELKKAIADKQAAEMGVEINTALAIAKTLPMLSNPLTAAIGAAEIALITTLGAEQYSVAASAQLPQFAKGGKHYGGGFVAGEKGFELIQPVDKPAYFSTSTASIYNEKSGTTITSHDETKRIIESAVLNVYSKQTPTYKDNFAKEVAYELSKIIGGKFEEVGEGIQYAVWKSKTTIKQDNQLVDYLKRKDNLTSSFAKK